MPQESLNRKFILMIQEVQSMFNLKNLNFSYIYIYIQYMYCIVLYCIIYIIHINIFLSEKNDKNLTIFFELQGNLR